MLRRSQFLLILRIIIWSILVCVGGLTSLVCGFLSIMCFDNPNMSFWNYFATMFLSGLLVSVPCLLFVFCVDRWSKAISECSRMQMNRARMFRDSL